MSTSLVKSLGLLVALVTKAAPLRACSLAALALAGGALSAGVIAATGLAVDRASSAAATGFTHGWTELVTALVLVGGLLAAGQVLTPMRDSIAATIGSMVAQQRRRRLLAAALRPAGIAHLEDPAIADEMQRAGDVEGDMGPLRRIVSELGRALTTLVGAIGAALLLTKLTWWAPIVCIAAVAATHALMHRGEYDQIVGREKHARTERKADYSLAVSLDPPASKEIRLFGLAGYLAEQTRRLRLEFFSHVWSARRLRRRNAALAVAVLAIANGAVLAYVAIKITAGDASVSDIAVYLQAIAAVTALGYGSALMDTWWVYQGAATIPHLMNLERPGYLKDLSKLGSASADSRPRSEITFEGVRFGYGDRLILDGLNLRIPAGRSLAIVGANGSGKTTLLKLLTRLYDPEDGRILIDGMDMRNYDVESWRRQIAVIFQDFVRYELSARENIALDRPCTPEVHEAMRQAAVKVGAMQIVDELPREWDTILSRQYPGGADLSGGQWQRIALARAVMAADEGARLLVLDEPTASLDIRAEANLFERFLELTAGKTTLLVTHRLSTVRHVDQIAVLDKGRVVEQGTHAELLSADGMYAQMFRLQADRFGQAE